MKIIDGIPLFRTPQAAPGWVVKETSCKQSPKIYLAGKIRKNCWRHSMVDGLDYAIDFCTCGEEPPYEWPILRNAIMGKFDYVGPYFIGCDHGCFHGNNSHGYTSSIVWEGDDGHMQGELYGDPRKVHELCLMAIHAADIVFAWIDQNDAYGTIAELGYAKALGKKIFIASPQSFRDMWFVYELADETSIGHSTPLQAFCALLDVKEKEPLPVFESPIEELFWREWQQRGGESALPIVYQYSVPGSRYRIDFAYPQLKVAIELDGYAFHSDKDVFTKDRQRQRDLEMFGWRFVRFSGAEITKDVSKCFDEACRFIGLVKDANGGNKQISIASSLAAALKQSGKETPNV